ncbi:phytanoyl-CoA dioxygenase family protein [Ilumatobacter coccineus]|uniref:Putative oxygenase n=1 Tax=Ilumatobacter coccineus (strain NBRC 103263 / KCTC 29153 / YM16-304) TaxID=1313172 RepID=A0A6C7EDG8_ILUCY|nr:phytanoyl-CoA dioxygenase family protein [Ilumatobacter coccineus]BAN04363.1 putative oxygenase [Ilumatobacter coccineus YM16-304]
MLTSTEATEQWNRNGWLLVDDAVDERGLAELREAIDELTAWASNDGPGLHHFEQTDSGPALARSERFADVHERLGAFVRSGIVTDVVGAMLGEPAVLFKEKVNYKHPGGGGFAPHQDAPAYRFVDHHVSVMVPIDPATVASGCLWFAPGHTHGQLDTDERGRLTDAAVASLDWQPIEVRPGQLLAFDSYAPHRSDTNTTNHPRRALYLTYNAASRGDFREAYYADKDTEFARGGARSASGTVRVSISDDFLGRPVA